MYGRIPGFMTFMRVLNPDAEILVQTEGFRIYGSFNKKTYSVSVNGRYFGDYVEIRRGKELLKQRYTGDDGNGDYVNLEFYKGRRLDDCELPFP